MKFYNFFLATIFSFLFSFSSFSQENSLLVRGGVGLGQGFTFSYSGEKTYGDEVFGGLSLSLNGAQAPKVGKSDSFFAYVMSSRTFIGGVVSLREECSYLGGAAFTFKRVWGEKNIFKVGASIGSAEREEDNFATGGVIFESFNSFGIVEDLLDLNLDARGHYAIAVDILDLNINPSIGINVYEQTHICVGAQFIFSGFYKPRIMASIGVNAKF